MGMEPFRVDEEQRECADTDGNGGVRGGQTTAGMCGYRWEWGRLGYASTSRARERENSKKIRPAKNKALTNKVPIKKFRIWSFRGVGYFGEAIPLGFLARARAAQDRRFGDRGRNPSE